MASKKNEDTKKRVTAKAAAPAKKAAAAKKAAPAKKATTTTTAVAAARRGAASKVVPAKVPRPSRQPAGRQAKVDDDCCEQLTRKVDGLRKELRESMRALQQAVAARTPPARRSTESNVLNSLQFLGIAQITVNGGAVSFELPGATVTLSDVARDHGKILLELRPGGTANQPLPLTPELYGILEALFEFLVHNAGYLSTAGLCATCGGDDD